MIKLKILKGSQHLIGKEIKIYRVGYGTYELVPDRLEIIDRSELIYDCLDKNITEPVQGNISINYPVKRETYSINEFSVKKN